MSRVLRSIRANTAGAGGQSFPGGHLFSGIWKPLLFGLVVREVLAPFTGHPFDFEIWVRLGVFMQSGMNPYSLLPFVRGLSFNPSPFITSISYPPLPAFVFGSGYLIYEALGSASPYLYYFILKQPMVLSDLAVAILLYKIASLHLDLRSSKRLATLWLCFPFAIIVSSVWGALDPVALALVLATLYFGLTNRPMASGIALGFGVLFKLMPIIYLPAVLIQPSLSNRSRIGFAAVSLSIPLLGTLAPFLALGWGFSGFFAAESFQGSLPGFGGLGAFNFLSLLEIHDGYVSQVLSLAWLAALLGAYGYCYFRKSGLVESFLVTSLLFSIFRPVMPEQWAVYPLAFLLLLPSKENRVHFLSLTVLAGAFLVTNNLLLVRFLSPVYPAALSWDQYIDGPSAFADVRYALMLVLSIFFSFEALATAFNRRSVLKSKFDSLRSLTRRSVAMPVAYLFVVSITGGILDYTATKMVTDWALAIQSSVFLGLSWLSLYHIMLVLVFEATAVLVALFSGRGVLGSINLLLTLTFLNIASAAFALVLYRGLEGIPLVATTTIYLASSIYVTEEAFVVFALTLSALGIVFLSDIERLLTFFPKGVRLMSSFFRGSGSADSISSPS